MAISFTSRVRVPDDILISGLQSESVILNLDSERYFGFGRCRHAHDVSLTDAVPIQTAYETLLEEYEVEGEVLSSGFYLDY